MEVQHGFIVNVSSFCDRWCARCPLTKRCELFVTHGGDKISTTADSRATLLEQVEIMLGVANMQSARATSHCDERPSDSKLPLDLEPSTGPDPYVVKNGLALHRKRQRARFSSNAAVRLAMETLDHFMLFVSVRMLLCLGTVSKEGAGPRQSEANGWGKAALLGLERMSAAWRLLVDTRHFSEADVEPFLAEIARMQRNIDRAVPNARAFVRPGFDERDEVEMLEAVTKH